MLIFEFNLLSKASNYLRLTTISRVAKIHNLFSGKRTITNEIKAIEDAETSSVVRSTRPRRSSSNSKVKESALFHRERNIVLKYDDVKSYLEYASYRNLKTTSGIFIGNLYELKVKKYLEENFRIRSTIHQGGSNDKGIDINAIWNPTEVFKEEKHESNSKIQIVNSKRVKPLVFRNNRSLKLFVQCKCYNSSKIDPKLIREIKGSCQEYFKKHGNSAVFMIASTNGLTKIGKEDFDKAPIPFIFAKFSRPRLMDSKYPYRLESWDMGKLIGLYMNPMAIALFKGLDWINFVNKAQ